MGRKKNKTKSISNDLNTSSQDAQTSKNVRFNASSNHQTGKLNGIPTIPRSPSANTLNVLDRETYTLWKRPFWTLIYCFMEIISLAKDFLKSLLNWRRFIPCILIISAAVYMHFVPGEHKKLFSRFEKPIYLSLYWIWMGVLSSIGLGTGLHTFVLYLGPHIAHVTMAAFECNSLDFPEPPYPAEVTCPTNPLTTNTGISLWDIVRKVRLESLMWGFGTALGELPPFFMARAARLSGREIDDEEYNEYRAYVDGNKAIVEEKGFFEKGKIHMEKIMEDVIKKIGFFGILVFASIPNPLFDLAGMTCGHFLIPFWTFFGATVIGKAIVKMHIQSFAVVIAFSEHHFEELIKRIKIIPKVGDLLHGFLKEYLLAEKKKLHRRPDQTKLEQTDSSLQKILSFVVIAMIIVFLSSLVNSLAQKYHKRCCVALKQKNA